MKRIGFVVALCLVLPPLSGCASKQKGISSEVYQDFKDAPDWFREDCNAYLKKGKDEIICGVGIFKGSRNIALAKSAAENRARTNIARALQTQIKAMFKDYQSTTTGGEEFGQAAADEQYVEDVSKQITDMTLSGTRLEKWWVSKSGVTYVLMVLDMENFGAQLSRMKDLNEQLRRQIIDRADKAFRELDRETDDI